MAVPPRFIAAAVFLTAFAVYLWTMVPSVTGDDSGELAAVGVTLGTAHPPGYPLYSLAAKAAVTLVPWGNDAYRVNMVSALFIALACGVLFFGLHAVSGNSVAAAALALVFAFAANVWAMANVTEVYGIAALLAGLLALAAVAKPSRPLLIAVAYLFGIALTAHYTMGLLLPGLLWWAYRGTAAQSWKERTNLLPLMLLAGVAGFSVVAFLYLRAQADALVSWEDPQTLERFWQVVARLRYGSMALAQGGAPPFSPDMILHKILFFFRVTADNFTWAGVALFLLGGVAWLRDRERGWGILLMLLCSGPGFLVIANVGLTPSSEALLQRFFFLSYVFLVLVMARGIRSLPRAASYASLFIPVFLLAANASALNHRHEFLFLDYAKNILRTTPPHAVLLSDRADEMEFCVAYLLTAEGLRPDLRFTDCNAGISHSIYGDGYYRVWGAPRLALRTAVEKEIVAGSEQPVYYATFHPRMIDIPRRQEGLLYRAKPLQSVARAFPCDTVYSLRVPPLKTMDDRARNLLLSHFQLTGQYSLEAGDTGSADRQFRGLAAFDGTGSWTSTIGFLYHQKGALPQAEAFYRRAISAGKGNADIYANLGALCEIQGRRDDALNMYRAALEADPLHVQAHFNLAVLHWKNGEWPEVVRSLDQVLSLDPQHRDARQYREAALRRM